MTIDEHNACAVCAIQVQELYAAAHRVLAAVDRGERLAAREALEELRKARLALEPFIDAHFANHDHAMSPDLVTARQPTAPATLVLARVLPFGER